MKLTKKLLIVFAIMLVTVLAVFTTASMAIDLTITGNVEERTLSVYKVFDLTADGKNYSWDETTEEFFATYDTDAEKEGVQGLNTIYEATEYLKGLAPNSQELFDFAEAYYAYTGTEAVATQTAATDATSVVFTGLTPGYYIVYDETTSTAEGFAKSAAIISQLTADTPVEIKAETIEVGKVADVTNASIGDTVNFDVTSTVPDMIGYETYTFNVVDTLSDGLVFNNDVTVKIGDTVLVKDTDYTVTPVSNEDGTTTVTIEFKNFINQKANAGKTILVEYSATLDADAVITNVVTNTVEIVYSNDPTTNETGTSVPVEVKVYTFSINAVKKDSKGNTLEGAEFVLKVGDKYATFDENGVFTGLVDTEAEATKVVSDANGLVKIYGLEAGSYILKEVKAPNEYTLPNFEFKFTITPKFVDGELTTVSFNYTTDEEQNNAKGYIEDTSSSTPVINIVILNAKEGLLPSTGGMGTTIFTVVGISLMVVAAVVLVVRNRKEN